MLKKDRSLFSYIKKLLEKQSFTIIEAYFKLYLSNFSTLVSDKFDTWLFGTSRSVCQGVCDLYMNIHLSHLITWLFVILTTQLE